MDLQQAYQETERHLYSVQTDLADRIEQLAMLNNLSITWLNAAGAYARAGDREKFTQALLNASKTTQDPAVTALYKNSDSAYELIMNDLKFIKDSKKLFAKEIQKRTTTKIPLEQITKMLENSPTTRFTDSVLLSTGDLSANHLIFQTFKIQTKEDEKKYIKKINDIKQNHNTSYCPSIIDNAIEGNIGWFLGIF